MLPHNGLGDVKFTTLRELKFAHNIFRAELFFAHLIFAQLNKEFSRTIFFAHPNPKNNAFLVQNWGFWPANLKSISKELFKFVEIFQKFHTEVVQNWVWKNNWKFCYFFQLLTPKLPLFRTKISENGPFLGWNLKYFRAQYNSRGIKIRALRTARKIVPCEFKFP